MIIMKFQCNLSKCIYTFEAPLDIKAMLQSQDYTAVEDAPAVVPKAPVKSTTVVPVKPVEPAPDKPLPVALVVPKAV